MAVFWIDGADPLETRHPQNRRQIREWKAQAEPLATRIVRIIVTGTLIGFGIVFVVVAAFSR